MRANGLSQIVGNDQCERIRGMRILLVGAGGIGCEMLKNLILVGFGEIHVVDLDTIDLSNLNRQFLFRHRDVKKPKVTTAVEAVKHFSDSKLVAHQGNIMDGEQFPLSWFGMFDVIFNALDNLAARRHVNRMVQFLGTPLLESGTAGFDGYIQPLIPGKTECFDCTAKETPKTFPVCTIRSTPSTPLHCIVWAKNFLFQQLFSGVTEDIDTEDNSEELERIRQESKELGELQQWISSGDMSKIDDIVRKLFVEDIKKLLAIENLWRTRVKPEPLTNFSIGKDHSCDNLNEVWSLQQNLNKFVAVTEVLMERMKNEPSIEFDKDDVDTLLFVATAANIRAHIFHIPLKSVFDIKQIAGNIIPAIVSTNAIIAGLSSLVSLRVLNMLKIIDNDPLKIPMSFTAKASNISTNRYLSSPLLSPPNPECAVCMHYQRAVLKLNKKIWKELTLGKLNTSIQETYGFSEEVSILDSSTNRLLFDYDFDSLKDSTLEKLNLSTGSILAISDELVNEDDNTTRKPIEIYIEISDEAGEFTLPALPMMRIVQKEEEEAQNQTGDNEETSKGTDHVIANDGTITIDDEDDNNDDDKDSKHTVGRKRSLNLFSESEPKRTRPTPGNEHSTIILD
ncbi:HGL331Wp [Eremothecium sinecaudum]|uniref:Ubiquitin-activating enzyme E1-like n=1 Tax=Eremothecium sinecaudum TaxID=45286 RepID=A0A0X8HV15_9SACH|nr:HGL331Wp [Eremothecium sinecaudum]AMD22009.1 HGL331Wp [Eremothecium sinecaudum]